MAIDGARRRRQQTGTKSFREVGRVGSSGARNKKDDPNVRKQRRMSSPRHEAAKAEAEANERHLASLEEKLAATVAARTAEAETVEQERARLTQEHIAEAAKAWDGMKMRRPRKVETKTAPVLAAAPEPEEPKPLVTPQDVQRARDLILQGYHILRVVERTGVPVKALRSLVNDSGYRRRNL